MENYSNIGHDVPSLLFWFAVLDPGEDILEHLDTVKVSEKTRKPLKS
jgi:hypothetical protein